MKLHYECAGVGHYGIFNGSRFRLDIAPRITQFVRTHDTRAGSIPTMPGPDHEALALHTSGDSQDVSCAAFAFGPAIETESEALDENLKALRNIIRQAAESRAPGRPQASPIAQSQVPSSGNPKRRPLKRAG